MKKPLIFYSISVFMGCFSIIVLNYDIYIGAVLAASFLSLMFFTIDKEIFIFSAAFFIIGIFAFMVYFNVNFSSQKITTIRIEEKSGYSFTGTSNGRRVLLKGFSGDIKAGSKIMAVGSFTRIPDYEKGIVGEFKIESITGTKEDYLSTFFKYREDIYNKMKSRIGAERAGIIAAACFGETSYLSKDDMEDYKRLGIIHVISVSGLHLSLVYKIVEKAGGFGIAILFSLFYVVFTGGKPPTLRAFIMIAILKLAGKLQKRYDGISSLSLSAMVLILWKPYYVCDLGFMLSFLSVLGIMLHYKQLTRLFARLPKMLNEGISMTLSAQCFSTPLAMVYFNSFSTGFALGNLFLIPLYSIIVVLGNAAAVFVKIDLIFNVFCRVLVFFMTAVDGGKILLLKLCPPMLHITYGGILAFAVTYISYVLYRYGKRDYILMPALTFILIFGENYSFFPEIRYIKEFNNTGIIIKYKSEALLFLNSGFNSEESKEEVKWKYNVDKVVSLKGSDKSLNLGNEYKIFLREGSGNSFNTIEIDKGTKKILVTTRQTVSAEDEVYSNYDIIYLKSVNSQGEEANLRKLPVFWVVFDKVFLFS